jgi:hypothetical protein
MMEGNLVMSYVITLLIVLLTRLAGTMPQAAIERLRGLLDLLR